MSIPGKVRPVGAWWPRRVPSVLVQVTVILLLMGVITVGPSWYVRRQGTQITKKYQPIVQAICNFRAETGLLPYELTDLQTRFPVTIPSHVAWSNYGAFDVFDDVRLSYLFDDEDEHWSCFFGRLSVPPVVPTVPTVTGQQRIEAALAEYDRRIATYPEEGDNLRHRTAKMALLSSLERNEEVYAECLAALPQHPNWWRARLGAALLAPEEDRATREAELRAWVERSPGLIHSWYLAKYYREQDRHAEALQALRQGGEYPLEDIDIDAMWVPHAFAFEAAAYACQQGAPQVVLAICDSWSEPQGVYNYASPDLPAFQAAALLQLGRTAEAKAAVQRVIAESKQRAIWAGNLDQLEDAIQRDDRTFVYDPGQAYAGFGEWALFPQPEFQPAESRPPTNAPSSSD